MCNLATYLRKKPRCTSGGLPRLASYLGTSKALPEIYPSICIRPPETKKEENGNHRFRLQPTRQNIKDSSPNKKSSCASTRLATRLRLGSSERLVSVSLSEALGQFSPGSPKAARSTRHSPGSSAKPRQIRPRLRHGRQDSQAQTGVCFFNPLCKK